MASKAQAHDDKKPISKQRSSRSSVQDFEARAGLTHPAPISWRAGLDPHSLTQQDVRRLQRTIGNRAVGRLLAGDAADTARITPASTRSGSAVIQRYYSSRLYPGARLSDKGRLVLTGPKQLYAAPEAITEAAAALASLGALVTVKPSRDNTTYDFESRSLVKVELGINPGAVKGKLWERLKSKQPGQGYGSFADCFRTSATVSGINPGVAGQREELRLPTGTVPVMTNLEAGERGVTNTPAARAAASFFLHAFPKFLEMLTALDAAAYGSIITQLEGFGRKSGPSQTQAGPIVYKIILANPAAKRLFAETFGINEAMAPAIGTALTQVNDPAEKEAAEGRGEEKWNFHWAGVIMKDDKDYVTLENCAVEISDATADEIMANADIVNEATNPQDRTMKRAQFTKQDLINDRWYFKMYGPAAQSFHTENVADTHATPSAITLPVSKG